MAQIKLENIGLAIKGGGISVGRSCVLHNLDKISVIVFANDMSRREMNKILNVLEGKHKILYCNKSKAELGKIFGRAEVGVFGIKRKFENLLISKEEKSESSEKH